MSSEQSYANLMRQALTEAIEIKEGRRQPARASHPRITTRQVTARG